MAFGPSDSSSKRNSQLAEINMIPMIDVMLVLLIIFMVTAPLLTHAVKIDLPRASSNPQVTQVKQIQVAIKTEQEMFWDGERVDEASVSTRLDEAAKLDEQPEIHLHVDKSATYERVAIFLSEAANRGLTKIAFVTDPSSPN